MTPAQTLAAYLRPSDAPAVPLDPVLSSHIRDHGIGPLLQRAMRERGVLNAQPGAIRDELARLSREEALIEPFRREEAERTLDALAAAGVPAIVFKGTALAYACYPDPSLRPRLDTDLLIRRQDVDAASRVFERLGCTRTLRTSGQHVTHQFTYVRTRLGLSFAFDVHWKIADPQPFADLFRFEELDRDAKPLAGLGPHARTLSSEHALLVACTHRVAHHYDREVLIDLCDIDLLAGALDAPAWVRVANLAFAKRIRRVVARGLELTSERLGTAIPAGVLDALTANDGGGAEPTAAYLTAGFRKVDILAADLRELGWSDRLQLLGEHLFPPPAFVLKSFGRTQPILLPVLYTVRIVRGAGAWFRQLR